MKAPALSALHDFEAPLLPSWRPQTIGWYGVFTIVLVALVWLAWRSIRRWRANRYRVEALRELRSVDVTAIPELLKRTALAAWPRKTVASLSGEDWLEFLQAHEKRGSLDGRAGEALLQAAYQPGQLHLDDERLVRQSAEQWIREHRVHP